MTAALGVAVGQASGAARRARSAGACATPDNLPATRDPSNPLDLPAPPPVGNPLTGAQFFIDGPAHGAAAGAVAQLMGLNPKRMSDSDTWGRFYERLQGGRSAHKLGRDPGLAHRVNLLEKIASEPEANRFSLYSGGGGPGAIYGQVHKIYCHNVAADPGSVPIFTTFFLYQAGYCESKSEILAHRGTFQRQIDEMARGIDKRPAVMLLELDAIGASACMQRTGALPYWLANIRYEVDKVAALPHTVVYVEGGYADSNSPSYTTRALRAVDIHKIRGFFTNDTHEDWTIDEVRWAQRVSRLTGGTHFIVNTATNGAGPLVPRNRVRYGNEILCNPPGRGIGPLPTTTPTDPRTKKVFAGADAFLWTAPPGNSSGTCNGGPASGTFWAAKALALSARANGKLGPGYPSQPY
ncbi:MAG TPA: glycoside hydrolase family 6 protein [Solirubrobacteraceae bacterium]